MRITESAAYLKGLSEGLELTADTKETKILVKMLEVIEEMAARIDSLEEENSELYACLEELSNDVMALEDDFYEIESEEDYDDLDDLDDDYEGEEEDYYEIECPSCGEKICFAEDVELESLACPACGELVGEIEFCDEECDCCDKKDSCEA